MRLLWIGALAVMGVMLLSAEKKNEARFTAGAASSYTSKQTNDNVTVAAIAYDSDELAHKAFGKLNPNDHGVLPVLIIIQNDTSQSMRLDGLHLEYMTLDRSRIEPTPAEEVRFVGVVPKRAPPIQVSPIPLPKKKGPLSGAEIPERAFAARMLPPHESASGFFYFQTASKPGSRLYLTGINEAMSGKGLLYFEIPLDK